MTYINFAAETNYTYRCKHEEIFC